MAVAMTLFISVIVPTLNEASRIESLISETRGIGECEIIVVDGGSTDDTLTRATAADIVLSTEPGRARQQNVGAAASTGDILLFLHADCRLTTGAFDAIRTTLVHDERIAAGCFRQKIDAEGWMYRLLEKGNAARVRWMGLAYGDQAIFIRRQTFDELGRFANVKLMEDVLLMKRLRKVSRIALLDACVTVSPRRWQRHGIIRQTLRNWLLLFAALCGVSPDSLARFYPNTR